MSVLIKCESLSKIYDQEETKVTALNNVSLTINEGEFVSLVGPSGSGKSTLLNLIGALDTPTSGKVTVDGVNLAVLSKSQLSDLRLNNISFVFQAYNLIPVLSARENVEFVMELQGVSPKERKERSIAILEEVGLKGLESRRPSQLSGGQQQRVAVARAVVTKPRLLLADEPTANLDSNTARNLVSLMREMNEKLGITFIFSTHDPIVMEFARRIIKLRDGAISEDIKS